MKALKDITVKTGTREAFIDDVKGIMRAIDKGEMIQSVRTLIFEDPTEMLQFLSEAKIKLIKIIRNHPASISDIARAIKRNRAAVYRDIHEMEKFGLVETHNEINPGHGRHKIVRLVASNLKLEASI